MTDETIKAPTEGARWAGLTGNGFVDGSLAIALLTSAGYITMYFYEVGFCRYFGIPLSLIEVNLTKLAWIPVAAGALSVFIQFLGKPATILEMVLKTSSSFRRRVYITSWILAWGLLLYWASGAFILFVAILPLSIVEFAWPLIDRKKGGTYWSRLNTPDTMAPNIAWLDDKFRDFIGFRTALVLWLCMMSASLSYLLGQGIARSTDQFELLVYDDDRLTLAPVILARYDENFVCCFLSESKELTHQFTIVSTEALSLNRGWYLVPVSLDSLKMIVPTIGTDSMSVETHDTSATVDSVSR